MAKIPLYQSKEQLTTVSPQGVRESPQAAGQLGRDLQGAGNALTEAHNVIRQAYDFQQVGSAKLKTIEGTNAIEQKALADGENTTDLSSYESDLSRLKADTLKGISNPAARAKFEMDFDLQAAQTRTKVKAIFWNRVKEKSIANLTAQNEHFKNEYAETGDASLLKAMELNTDTYVKAGIIGADDAEKIKIKIVTDAKYNNFLSEYRANPIESEKKFNSGGYGLDIETAEKARVRLKELKAIYREAEGETYNELQNKLYTGNLSEIEIDSMVLANIKNPNEGITSTHGKSLKNALYRDITKRIGIKEYAKHKKAIDYIFSNSQQDKVKGYEAILAAYEDGLTNDEAAFLDKILKTKKDIVFANKAAAGKKMLEQLFGARPKNVADEQKALLNYARRIANGLDPEQAAQDTAMEVIKEDHPAVVANPDLAGAFSPRKGYKSIPKVKQETK